jgi:hypothetical protein
MIWASTSCNGKGQVQSRLPLTMMTGPLTMMTG